jgi:hypothetical protein
MMATKTSHRSSCTTPGKRIAMGLHVRDTTPSTIPAPTSHPELNIEVFDVRRLKVAFRNAGSTSKAKPYGVNGALIGYAVLDTPPTSPTALSRLRKNVPNLEFFPRNYCISKKSRTFAENSELNFSLS